MSGDSTDEPGESSTDAAIGRAAAFDRGNLGTVLALVAIVLSAGKVLAVSQGDFTTAIIIIHSQGWAVLPSALFAVLPRMTAVTVFVLGLVIAECIWIRGRILDLTVALALTLVLGLAVGDWLDLALSVAATMVMVGIGLVLRVWSEPPPRRGFLTRVHATVGATSVVALVTAMVFDAVTSSQPWLPAEQITTSGATYVGYVLNDDSNRLLVLLEPNHQVVAMSGADVQARSLCHVDKARRSPLALLVRHSAPSYPL